ncbi:caspase family protein, partial [Candidatus Poribacteria bacterium]|nr:caspase family protein [Candidatus Poribacteria bacterium]
MRHITLRTACAALIMAATLTAARADTYAVLVGINDYQYFGVRDLQYSESDVELMRDTLTRHCGVPPEHIRVLLGKEATRRAIGLAIRVWLAESTQPDDRVLFYFAGHGTQLQDDNGDEEDGLDESLWAWDTGILDLTWVRDDDLNRWLSAVPAREKVVILDCCHSGTGSRFLGENRVRAASVPMSEVRITSLETKLEAEQSIEAEATVPAASPVDMSAFTTPGAGDTVAEFSACLPHQLVVETAQYKHGAMTYFLTEGLRGAADDDADGVITLGELQAYSARRIQEHGFPQEPQLYGTNAESFALVEGPPQAMRGAVDA